MKNELGIEICCENCKQCTSGGCGLMEMANDYIFRTRHCVFSPSKEAYEARIKELQEIEFENKLEKSHLQKEIEKAYNFISKLKEKIQEQQFTEEELQFIKDRLDECIEEWDMPEMVFMAHQILKKIEQTLKNSEANLKNER